MTTKTKHPTFSSMKDLETSKKKMTYPSERSLDDIYTYEKQALDLIEKRFENNKDHPNYKELKALLIDQINDELKDYATNTDTD